MDLAGLNGVGKEMHPSLDRGQHVRRVQLVQVDGVHLQPLQRLIQRIVQAAARQAMSLDFGPNAVAALGGKNGVLRDIRRPDGDPASDNRLGLALGIDALRF